MRETSRSGVGLRAGYLRIVACLSFVIAGAGLASAQPLSLDDLISGVVKIKTYVNPDGRTLQSLGRERVGSGIVIDGSGLILTIGYLMVEAHAAEVTSNDGRVVPAEILGYDHETGFGLMRALAPMKVRPIELGKSSDLKERAPVLAVAYGGRDMVAAVNVVAKREFAGNWEYMLSEAIFSAPAHPHWSGAALINHEGKLVGVGSLIVNDASGKNEGIIGNMFVPIDLLPPIMADLISGGRVSGPGRPWLGLSTEDARGRLVVSRVVPDSPAEKAGLQRGDVIVGVAGAAPNNLADFYRKIWAVGDAGATVHLDVMQGQARRSVDVKSMNCLDHLKLKSSF